MNYTGKLDPKFKKYMAKLPERIQIAALETFRLWLEDNSYNSLQFKNIKGLGRGDIYSIRVTKNYRMLGELEDDLISWFWVGPHDEYMRLLKRL